MRAVAKSKYIFEHYSFDIENKTEISILKELLGLLVSTKLSKQSFLQMVMKKTPSSKNATIQAGSQLEVLLDTKLDQCRKGFDESVLFQVSQSIDDPNNFWRYKNEKETMKEQFRLKFRNISRIMDCVTW